MEEVCEAVARYANARSRGEAIFCSDPFFSGAGVRGHPLLTDAPVNASKIAASATGRLEVSLEQVKFAAKKPPLNFSIPVADLGEFVLLAQDRS